MDKKKKPEPKNEVTVTSNKRVAKDGSQRGLKRKGSKNKLTILQENIAAAITKEGGHGESWDEVVVLNVIAYRALNGYGATDGKGNPVLDLETGLQIQVPPDLALAAATLAKAAPFTHQHLKPRESGEEYEADRDPDEKKEQILAALENMGVKVER